MSETAWWVIVGVALLLAVAGAMRFDLLGAILRDRLEHGDGAAAPPEGAAPDAPAEHSADPRHLAHSAGHRKPPYHRSGRRT
jgi:hypothetical protein